MATYALKARPRVEWWELIPPLHLVPRPGSGGFQRSKADPTVLKPAGVNETLGWCHECHHQVRYGTKWDLKAVDGFSKLFCARCVVILRIK